MIIESLTKYARMSPKKVIHVTRVIQGRMANDAVDLLKFIPRKSARLILETLKSAIANAENNHNLSSDTLIVRKAVVETGPVLKRFQPVPRGQAFPIRKRQSHIRIWLEPKQSAKK
ncbi:MAG TPA: 50S ribosomal protein L22 [Opitutales bacterium]|nr:50S ribosomal protein L22 [Opitutales bacterium]